MGRSELLIHLLGLWEVTCADTGRTSHTSRSILTTTTEHPPSMCPENECLRSPLLVQMFQPKWVSLRHNFVKIWRYQCGTQTCTNVNLSAVCRDVNYQNCVLATLSFWLISDNYVTQMMYNFMPHYVSPVFLYFFNCIIQKCPAVEWPQIRYLWINTFCCYLTMFPWASICCLPLKHFSLWCFDFASNPLLLHFQ